MPFTSELNIADNAKKLINMNGANLNPMYIIDFTFNTLIIFELNNILYKYNILFTIYGRLGQFRREERT
jgi:hypothetical protein